jgi:hypothetical protein
MPFTGPMVCAIRDGRKTQMRRVVRIPCNSDIVREPTAAELQLYDLGLLAAMQGGTWQPIPCPYGVPGDRLWVRETWAHVLANGSSVGKGERRVIYAADCPATTPKWRPSIYMPRWASRYLLEITGVRVERVQEISSEDACAEGCSKEGNGSYCIDGMSSVQVRFMDLWNKLNAKRGFGWDVNPWVWVLLFKLL